MGGSCYSQRGRGRDVDKAIGEQTKLSQAGLNESERSKDDAVNSRCLPVLLGLAHTLSSAIGASRSVLQ